MHCYVLLTLIKCVAGVATYRPTIAHMASLRYVDLMILTFNHLTPPVLDRPT